MSGAGVVMCTITYRRPVGLARLLQGIADLDDLDVVERIVVVDNDGDASARAVVDAARASFHLPVDYVVEPRRGITHARNTAVRTAVGAGAEWIAWLDDDESPRSDWLQQLLDTQRGSAADVVIGPSHPIFAADAPAWLTASGAFEPARFTTGEVFPYFHARTSGVIVRTAAMPPEGFDDRLALMGGEDRVFFTRMHRAGHRFVWCDDAVVDEWVPSSRTTVGWLVRRWYRTGVTRSFTLLLLDDPSWPRRMRRVAGGMLMALRGILGTVAATVHGRSATLAASRTIFLGVGASVGALGISYHEYRKVHGT